MLKNKSISHPIQNYPKSSVAAGLASGFTLGVGLSYLLNRIDWPSGESFRSVKTGSRNKVGEIMTKSPSVATEETPLKEVVKQMVKHDCGAIPIVDNKSDSKLTGILTDRDIICRVLAQEKNFESLKARDCMTPQTFFVRESTSIEECCQLMQEHQVRRLPVLDGHKKIVGIVSQADIAIKASPRCTSEVVREVSKPRHRSGKQRAA